MDLPQITYYRFNQILLHLVGQWPGLSKSTIIIRRIVVNVITISSIFPQSAKIITSGYDTNVLLDILPILMLTIVLPIHSICIYYNFEKFQNMLNEMREDWLSERTNEETKIKKQFAEKGYLITKFSILFCIVVLAFYLPLALYLSEILDYFFPLNKTRQHIYPVQLELFVDMEEHFHSIMVYLGVVFITFLIFVLANHTMFCAFMLHLYGMFAVLGYRLEHAVPKDIIETRENYYLRNYYFYKSIVLCIERHQKAIKFASILESYTAPFVFLFFLSTVLTISPSLVLLSSNQYSYRLILQAFYLTTFLFLFNYMGQVLIDTSTEIHEKIYLCNWEYYSPSISKMLLLTIKQSEKPCTISAYKLHTASFVCFRMLMQTIISYCMIIRKIK